jgi:hypothetical protein
MNPQEKQRLLFASIIAGVLHLAVLFLRFVVDFTRT